MNNNKKKKDKSSQLVRLNKMIADAGISSRRKADELISSGNVKVNGKVVTALGTKVETDAMVTINGDPIGNPERFIYILFNKNKNLITTTKDDLGRETVLDVVNKQQRIYPVGRLDRNTTGVLLLTNDGELANRLMHPRYQVEKTYSAKLDKPFPKEYLEQMVLKGIKLEDGLAKPYSGMIDPEDKSKVYITLFEGRNREVRRIFEHFGFEVKQLDRKSFAGLTHKNLLRNKYRHLKPNEVRALKKLVGIK